MRSIHRTSARVGFFSRPGFKTDPPQQRNLVLLVPGDAQSLPLFSTDFLLIFNGREHEDKLVTVQSELAIAANPHKCVEPIGSSTQ